MFENERTLIIRLTEKQKILWKAFTSPEITEILYWGWARWWKSRGVCEIITMTCLSKHWIVWLVGREERDDLRKTTLNTLLKVLDNHWMLAGREYTLNLQTKELKFVNGSKVLFVPLKQQPSDPEFNWLGSYEKLTDLLMKLSKFRGKLLILFCRDVLKRLKNMIWLVRL